MSARDPVAAIGEADARGDIAELYADIRATLGVPVVNLVWRHLASIDGALPWAWQAVRPAYRSGAVSHHAERLKAGLVLPAFCRWLNGHLAKLINFELKRPRGQVWDGRKYSRVRLVDDDAIFKELAYIITNPVAAGAVEQPAD